MARPHGISQGLERVNTALKRRILRMHRLGDSERVTGGRGREGRGVALPRQLHRLEHVFAEARWIPRTTRSRSLRGVFEEERPPGPVVGPDQPAPLLLGVIVDLASGTPQGKLVARIVLEQRLPRVTGRPAPSPLDPTPQQEVRIGREERLVVVDDSEQRCAERRKRTRVARSEGLPREGGQRVERRARDAHA